MWYLNGMIMTKMYLMFDFFSIPKIIISTETVSELMIKTGGSVNFLWCKFFVPHIYFKKGGSDSMMHGSVDKLLST